MSPIRAADPNMGSLGVYVDRAGVAYLVRETCSDVRPNAITIYARDDQGRWRSKVIAGFEMDAEVIRGWWQVPLFELESVGYQLVEGDPVSPAGLPFQVRVSEDVDGGAGWGSLVIEELPPRGWTLTVEGASTGTGPVEGDRPTDLACS